MIQAISPEFKNRGIVKNNLESKFENNVRSKDIEEVWYGKYGVDERTKVILSQPVTIVNKVGRHGLDYSVSPYQVDEQSYVRKYAQSINTLSFLKSLDFEKEIIVNENAAELLEAKLRSRSWTASPILLSGNIDCYHPVERKLKITRSLLELKKECRL